MSRSPLYVLYFAPVSFDQYDTWYALRFRAVGDGVFQAILEYMRALAREGKAQWKPQKKWWLVNDEAVEELADQIDGLLEVWLTMRGDYDGRMRAKKAEEKRQEARKQQERKEFNERMHGWYEGYRQERYANTASTGMSYSQACRILGVVQSATEEDIKRAWRKLSFKHHPDRGGDHQKIVEINNAYEYLMPKKGMSYE